MNARAGYVAGRCPGALSPMASGDGLIFRVKPRLGRLSLVQLEVLAGAAQILGDGCLYLSNRANIQIRAVCAGAHANLLELLKPAGLIDENPGVEAVRNVMLAPDFRLSAGFEAAEKLAGAIEGIFARNEILHRLPAKFGVAIQTGYGLDPRAVCDVTFLVKEKRIALMLEGALDHAFWCDGREAAVEGFSRVALAFLKAGGNDPEIRRMRAAVAKFGFDQIAKDAGLTPERHALRLQDAVLPVGDLGGAYGIALPFGEIDARASEAISETMHARGIAHVITSPCRALVLPCGEQDKYAIEDLAARIGAITNPNDIRLRVHGCPGQPQCARATVPARRNAEEVLSSIARTNFAGTVHISGCEKSCAYPHEATITAIGANGRYSVSGPGLQARGDVAPRDIATAVLDMAGQHR